MLRQREQQTQIPRDIIWKDGFHQLQRKICFVFAESSSESSAQRHLWNILFKLWGTVLERFVKFFGGGIIEFYETNTLISASKNWMNETKSICVLKPREGWIESSFTDFCFCLKYSILQCLSSIYLFRITRGAPGVIARILIFTLEILNLAVWDPSAPLVYTPPSPQEIAGSYPAAAQCVGRVVVKILGGGGAGGWRQRTGPVWIVIHGKWVKYKGRQEVLDLQHWE